MTIRSKCADAVNAKSVQYPYSTRTVPTPNAVAAGGGGRRPAKGRQPAILATVVTPAQECSRVFLYGPLLLRVEYYY